MGLEVDLTSRDVKIRPSCDVVMFRPSGDVIEGEDIS
jgi:hypothetical protein